LSLSPDGTAAASGEACLTRRWEAGDEANHGTQGQISGQPYFVGLRVFVPLWETGPWPALFIAAATEPQNVAPKQGNRRLPQTRTMWHSPVGDRT
jgi:hypothetical protein